MTQIPLGSLSLNADRKFTRSHVLDIAEKKIDDIVATYQLMYPTSWFCLDPLTGPASLRGAPRHMSLHTCMEYIQCYIANIEPVTQG